ICYIHYIHRLFFFVYLMSRPHPSSTLFPYTTLFRSRLTEKQVNALILSGSLDEFNRSRKSLLQESKKALDAVKDGVNQINLIDMVLGLTPVRSEVDVEELSQAEKINGEKEVLGF